MDKKAVKELLEYLSIPTPVLHQSGQTQKILLIKEMCKYILETPDDTLLQHWKGIAQEAIKSNILSLAGSGFDAKALLELCEYCERKTQK